MTTLRHTTLRRSALTLRLIQRLCRYWLLLALLIIFTREQVPYLQISALLDYNGSYGCQYLSVTGNITEISELREACPVLKLMPLREGGM